MTSTNAPSTVTETTITEVIETIQFNVHIGNLTEKYYETSKGKNSVTLQKTEGESHKTLSNHQSDSKAHVYHNFEPIDGEVTDTKTIEAELKDPEEISVDDNSQKVSNINTSQVQNFSSNNTLYIPVTKTSQTLSSAEEQNNDKSTKRKETREQRREERLHIRTEKLRKRAERQKEKALKKLNKRKKGSKYFT